MFDALKKFVELQQKQKQCTTLHQAQKVSLKRPVSQLMQLKFQEVFDQVSEETDYS